VNATIIGIDCATKPERVGLALGNFAGTALQLDTATAASAKAPPVETIATWVSWHSPVLLAFDAPLGWPADLGEALEQHEAGQPLCPELNPNHLFQRRTDLFVRKVTGKKPLEVGADRIARTAHAALKLLRDLRDGTGLQIPLAWEPGAPDRTCAIEVYPAATLAAYDDYLLREKRGSVRRKRIVGLLKRQSFHLAEGHQNLLEGNDHALDACVCLLAGVDFLRRDVITPAEAGVPDRLAQREGWIWLRRPPRTSRGPSPE
jgi:predicted RNase H-like nuclease